MQVSNQVGVSRFCAVVGTLRWATARGYTANSPHLLPVSFAAALALCNRLFPLILGKCHWRRLKKSCNNDWEVDASQYATIWCGSIPYQPHAE